MPRILDRLDVAVGLTPESIDHHIDYLQRRPSPPKLIDEEGNYNAGWFDRFDGEINLASSGATDLAFQTWIHFGLETKGHFIVFNMANFSKADNVAVLVCDKQTGRFEHASLTRLFPRIGVTLSSDFLAYRDEATGSAVTISPDHGEFRFSVHAHQLHIVGLARQAIAPPWTQVTRFQRHRGSLQRYGMFEIVHATLAMNDEILAIPPGTLGAYDHTVGHQRGLQAWNWLATIGVATCEQTGQTAPLGLQVTRDRAMARPVVDARKHIVWLDGQVLKIPAAEFHYAHVSAGSGETGPWTIRSPTREARWLDLVFEPKFHRQERRDGIFVKADFHQYYGTIHGRVHIDGRTWHIADWFGVTEESLLEF